ncbi:pentapeptide repeat-containing protein [Microbispora bryophytorum]|uniref:pentapeptide repeat-containing protein n=1 Tax=Microbispora bryophytorum TaxID=1460882 RepID=UPI0033C6BF30
MTTQEQESLEPKERIDALTAIRGARLQRINTWGVILGLAFTASGLVYTAQTLRSTQEGQITDRYTKAIEQVGSKDVDIRIGGIFALERIARDSPRDALTIAQVLSSHLRKNMRVDLVKVPGDALPRPAGDIRAALNVLAQLRSTPDYQSSMDLQYIDAHGLDLVGAPLYGADLTAANLSAANLYGELLESEALEGANLTRAELSHAELSHALLTSTNLSHATLHKATLVGANLCRSFSDSPYDYAADVYMASISGTCADLSHADLTDADLTDAIWREPGVASDIPLLDLRGADLRGAIGLPSMGELEKVALIDKSTKFH